MLEGSADPSLYEHIVDCDHCRDLKHEAARAAEVVKNAAADFRAPPSFAESIVAKINAARPNGPSSVAPSSTLPGAGRVTALPDTHQLETKAPVASSSAITKAPAEAKLTPMRPSDLAASVKADRDLDLATAPTALAPLDGPTTEPLPQMRFDDIVEPPAHSGKRSTGISEHARSSNVAPAVSGLDALSQEPGVPHHNTAVSAQRRGRLTEEMRAPIAVDAATRPGKATEPGEPAPSAIERDKVVTAKPIENQRGREPTTAKGGRVIPFFRRPAFIGSAALAMAAAAAAGFYMKGRTTSPESAIADAPWSGKIGAIARASADKIGGFEACDAGGACKPVTTDAPISQGTTLRTDARTRARVSLADGTWVALDRDTELTIASGKDRAAKLSRGSIVADVASLTQAKPATFAMDNGSVQVLGTKLQITAAKGRSSVEVARGSVRVAGASGKWVDVRAGEEATILASAEPLVASSTSLADVMEWSDQSQEEVDAPVLRGLGELRAKKPGDTKEKDRAVRLAKHSVKVRVVDLVARTEVDETFTNETDEELEGIFRFPLPPGAQIENLSLEVDGQMMQGAFVDRDKGAAIWRGVIQNAAPKQVKQREEIIWVPGPWRDPALLEWQRGGRFELRIFPIPKKGSRRVVLAYTQNVDQSGGVRRFTYPLAHDTSGTTKIDAFDMDVQVLGHDKEVGITTRGYELTSASGEGAADRRTLHANNFTPSGDLTVEYALPDRNKEVTAWAYRMDPASATPATTVSAIPTGAAATNLPIKATSPDEKAAIEAARTIASDTSPYVAIAVRPKLPRWQEQKERTHVIVVDTSRSMVGERFARARRLATTIVKEMDRRDNFVVLACDNGCRGMDGTLSPKPIAPGASAAADVEKFLSGIEPDGGSDLSAWMTAARAVAGSARDKEVRVLYLGDGTPTAGPTRASHLETAVRAAMPAGDGAIVAVALGADADMTSLQAMARGGGGIVVPYVPGQKVATAALEVLSAAYGVVLRDPEIELPQGLTQITPSRMDPIRAGGESIIFARMSVDGELTGEVKLRGRVSGERFEQTYPLKVIPTSSAGNAFVPRMFAAAKIAELERAGGSVTKPMIVELSKRFAVASEHTSLLVLESAAMFKAFGLDRGSVAPTFTGEERATSESGDAAGEAEADEGPADPLGAASEKKKDSSSGRAAMDDLGADAPGFGGGGFAKPAPQSAPAATASAGAMPPPKVASAPSKPMACSPGDPFCFDDLSKQSPARRPPSRRPQIAMKRVFERRAAFEIANTLAQDTVTKVAAAETALAGQPDSRDKTVALYALYATSGRLGEAQELTARWSGRDALDPDALLARADLAARQGDRERAIRILGGIADVRPGDKTIQTRLADLNDAVSNPARACAHRIALADLAVTDVKALTAAVSCARSHGMVDLAEVMRRDLDDKTRAAVDRQLAVSVTAPVATAVRGDVQVTAEWNGAADLDIAIIDAQGRRTSWLGGTNTKVTVSALNATSTRTESLGLLGLGSGSYIVEISRADGSNSANNVAFTNDVVTGEVTLRMPGGGVRKLPFRLNGARAEVGTLRVFFESKLVPVDGFGGGGWRF